MAMPVKEAEMVSGAEGGMAGGLDEGPAPETEPTAAGGDGAADELPPVDAAPPAAPAAPSSGVTEAAGWFHAWVVPPGATSAVHVGSNRSRETADAARAAYLERYFG